MAKIREITVWRDLLPSIFPTSCDDYIWLWNEIENGRIRVYQIGYDEKTISGFLAIEIRESTLFVHCAEGRRLLRHSGIDCLEWIAYLSLCWKIEGDITDGRRFGRILSRWNFRKLSEITLKSGFRQCRMRKVISWAKVLHRQIQRRAHNTPLQLQLTSGYRAMTLIISLTILLNLLWPINN